MKYTSSFYKLTRRLFLPSVLFAWLLVSFGSCSKDNEDVRMPDDIVGVWKLSDSQYYEFNDDNVVHNLQITYQDDTSIGIWRKEVYYYEPGYNLVIYLNSLQVMSVYQIIDMSADNMTWCWVKEVDLKTLGGASDVGKVIGDIIKEAQEGFKTDPDLYQSLTRISTDRFLEIIESLGIDYPWFDN